MICACGCGEEFEPKKHWQKFKDGTHRDGFWTKVRREAADRIISEALSGGLQSMGAQGGVPDSKETAK